MNLSTPEPCTPLNRTGKGLDLIVEDLNFEYDLSIPNPSLSSPSSRGNQRPLSLKCFLALKQLYFNRRVDIQAVLQDFKNSVGVNHSKRMHKSQQAPGTLPTGKDFLRRDGYQRISHGERVKRLGLLIDILNTKIHETSSGTSSFSTPGEHQNLKTDISSSPTVDYANDRTAGVMKKRKSMEDVEVFFTAPSSPVASPNECLPIKDDEFENLDWSEPICDAMCTTDNFLGEIQKPASKKIRQSTLLEYMATIKPVVRSVGDKTPSILQEGQAAISFSTTVASEISDPGDRYPLRNSFDTASMTNITEPLQDDAYEDIINGERSYSSEEGSWHNPREQDLIRDLRDNGPFSKSREFPKSVSIRHRYELERIAQKWRMPSNRILSGRILPYDRHEKFWNWVATHTQRGQNPLPEKSPAAAWDAAVGQFKVPNKHSQVVVFSGSLDWCDQSEPGILKLRLNPLRIERSCRFQRRFGSDRFLSLVIPAPSCPPKYPRFVSQRPFLRGAIAKWLTQTDHKLLGRTWKAFYVADPKRQGKKSRGRVFKVEFFAIDGIDFDHSAPQPPLAPIHQAYDQHTPMGLEVLLTWHISYDANKGQPDCKLFQRLALGLSKTWATVILRPDQTLPLKHDKDLPLMNDGCALMSRTLAREICDHIGISGGTPSCFQGRIAGAKGLWMVEKHISSIDTNGNDLWIQISDSQLKVNPHPRFWAIETLDDEKLTFEVVNWSKPLHPVELNVQLLTVLDHGGEIREYIAKLVRNGVRQLYQDFSEVIERDNILLGRILMQKIRPSLEEGLSRNTFRRLDHWVLDDIEYAIRLLEAGFSPRNFLPLRECMWKSLSNTLNHHVEELHIQVPLSTYAFCTADPYDILSEDEVHFGFSSQWQHPEYEDTLLDGVDVLVGRLPAYLPSDIQKRKAVWKPELRHLKDVIVFSGRGNTPLAHLLSGGDYDGDRPWICWDPAIVESFENSAPQPELPPEHFGLKRHSQSVSEAQWPDEFLQKTFMFNLELSSLGKCAQEHEKLIYGEKESIGSKNAKELAMLLSHLVDSRKGGLHLSEKAWGDYLKKISPRERPIPAFKVQGEKKGNPSNIIDYLKFSVAFEEREHALTDFTELCRRLNAYEGGDEDLRRPWNETFRRAEREKKEGSGADLFNALLDIRAKVDAAHEQWLSYWDANRHSPLHILQSTTSIIQAIRPPDLNHDLIVTWRNSGYEWEKLLASSIHSRYPRSKLVFYAMGETACRVKIGNTRARLISESIYGILRVNSKLSKHLISRGEDVERDCEGDVFGEDEAIEDLAGSTGLAGSGVFDDDGFSLENQPPPNSYTPY